MLKKRLRQVLSLVLIAITVGTSILTPDVAYALTINNKQDGSAWGVTYSQLPQLKGSNSKIVNLRDITANRAYVTDSRDHLGVTMDKAFYHVANYGNSRLLYTKLLDVNKGYNKITYLFTDENGKVDFKYSAYAAQFDSNYYLRDDGEWKSTKDVYDLNTSYDIDWVMVCLGKADSYGGAQTAVVDYRDIVAMKYAYVITEPFTYTFKSDSSTYKTEKRWGVTEYKFPASPYKSGYIFKGWKSNTSGHVFKAGETIPCDENAAINNIEEYQIFKDETFTALWEFVGSPATLTFNANGGTNPPALQALNNKIDFVAGKVGDENLDDVYYLGIPTKTGTSTTGYYFTGWYESKGGADSNNISDLVYDRYGELYYEASGWYYGDYDWDEDSWNTGPDFYHDKSATVYAGWKEINRYKITLNKNGGSGGSDNFYELYQINFYEDIDCAKQLPYINNRKGINSPSWEGHKFLGYYTSSTGGTQIIDENGRILISASYFTSNTTLYAHWQSSTVTFNTNGGKFSNNSTSQSLTTYIGDGRYSALGDGFKPTKDDYTFAGWYTSATGGTQVYTSMNKASTGITTYWKNSQWNYNSNITLYAHWNVKKSSVKIDLDGGKWENKFGDSNYSYTTYNYNKSGVDYFAIDVSGMTYADDGERVNIYGTFYDKNDDIDELYFDFYFDINHIDNNVTFDTSDGDIPGGTIWDGTNERILIPFSSINEYISEKYGILEIKFVGDNYAQPKYDYTLWSTDSSLSIFELSATRLAGQSFYLYEQGAVKSHNSLANPSFTITKEGSCTSTYKTGYLAGNCYKFYVASGQTVTATANWEPVKMTYVLHRNTSVSDSVTSIQTFYSDDTSKRIDITVPNTWVRTGYTHSTGSSAAWSTSSSGSASYAYQFSISNATIAANNGNTIHLYLKWTPIVYSVKYNGNGATSGSMSNSTHTYDKAANLTDNGFYRNFKVTYNANGGKMSNGQTTDEELAIATPNGWAYSATGNVAFTNKALVTNLANTATTVNLYQKWTDGSVTLPLPTRDGYTFTGWATAPSGGTSIGMNGASYTPTQAITLYALWTKNAANYSVVYHGNGATGGSTATSYHTVGTTSTLSNNGFYRNHSVKYVPNNGIDADFTASAAFPFLYWTTNADGSGTKYTNQQSINENVPNGTVINLYAQWGAGSVKLPAVNLKPGNSFMGWYNAAQTATPNESAFVGNTNSTYTLPYHNNTVLYAHWTPLKLKIRLYRNTSSTDNTYVEQEVSYGESNNKFNVSTVNTWTKSGYTHKTGTDFAWSYKSRTGNATYRYEQTIVDQYIIDEQAYQKQNGGYIDFYLQWTPCTYSNSLIYNANGGSNAPATQTATVTYPNTAYTHNVSGIPTAYTKTGYTVSFAGWYDAANGGTKVGTTITVGSNNYTGNQSKTIYAHWTETPIKYKNTLAYSGYSQWNDAQTVTFPNTAYTHTVTANVPTQTGYTFTGWYTASSGGTKVGTTYTVGSNNVASDQSVTLYPHWTANNYTNTLVYNANGGTGAPANQAVTVTYPNTAYTHTISATKPTRTGYDFVGWNTKADGTGTSITTTITVGSNNTVSNQSTTIYAIWKAQTYSNTLVYNANGGSNPPASDVKTVTYPNTAYTHDVSGIPTAPVETGYTFSFDGWYDAANGGTKVGTTITVGSNNYVGNQSKTIYAHWTKTPVKYSNTLSYDANGGTGAPANQTATVTYPNTAYTHSISTTKPTRTGYLFAGWYDAKTGGNLKQTSIVVGSNNVANNQSQTIYAHWTAITYTVAYNGNGATGGSTASSSHTYDVAKNLTANGYERKYTVTYDGQNGAAAKASDIANYTFAGWATTSNGNVAYIDKASVINLSSAQNATVTMYAKWNSASVTLPSASRTGYTFVGWYDAASGGNKIGDAGASYTPTTNVTLYAHWTANTYTVTYKGNGGVLASNTTKTEYSNTATYDSAYEVQHNIFQRTGYYFTGWGESANNTPSTWGSGTVNNAYAYERITSSSTDIRHDLGIYYWKGTWKRASALTLYACWSPNPYKIVFNVNKPSRVPQANVSGSMANQNFKYDTAQKLTANAYAISGWTFAGWNTKADGTGTSYANAAEVKNLTSAYDGTVTLYAQWNANNVNYVVNHYLQEIGKGKETNVSGNYVLKDTNTFSKEADTSVTISANTYTGFTYYTGAGTYTVNGNGTTVINIYYTRNSYTLSLSNGNGISGTSGAGTYQYGQSVTINATVKTGYTWSSWSGATLSWASGQNATTKNVTFTMPANNVSLTANATNNTYTVYLHSNDKPSSATNNIVKAGSVSGWTWDTTENAWKATFTYDVASTIPASNTAYTLTGWHTDSNWYDEKACTTNRSYGNKIWNLRSANGAVVHLYPKWIPNTYKVYLHSNDKPSKASSTITKVNALAGWTWSTTKNAWEATFTYDAYSTLPKSSAAYTLTGWHTDENWYKETTCTNSVGYGSVINLIDTEDGVVNLYPKWTANTYKVKLLGSRPANATSKLVNKTVADWTWVVDDATTNDGHYERTFTYDESYNLVDISNITLTGWKKTGWYFNNDYKGSGSGATPVKNLTTVNNGEVSLTLKWTAIQYTIKLDANKPSNASHDVVAKELTSWTYNASDNTFSKTFTYDDVEQIPTIPNTYSLVGWDDSTGWWRNKTDESAANNVGSGSKKWNLTTTENATVTLYPHWIANKYTVNLYANKPATASANVKAWGITGWTNNTSYYSKVLTYDTPSQLPNPYTSFSLRGWDVNTNGWYTTATFTNEASEKFYKHSEDVMNFTDTKNGTFNLYARWNLVTSDVTYDVDAGVYAGQSPSIGSGVTTYKVDGFTGESTIKYIACSTPGFTGVTTPTTDVILKKNPSALDSDAYDYYSIEAGKSYFTTTKDGELIAHSFVGWSVDPYATLSQSSAIVHKTNDEKAYVDLMYEYQAYLAIKSTLSSDPIARTTAIRNKATELENKIVLDTNRNVVVYAIWDVYPVIEVNNKTISSSAATSITKDDFYTYLIGMLDKTDSSDKEDGNLVVSEVIGGKEVKSSGGVIATFDDTNVDNALNIIKDKSKLIEIEGESYATTGAATVTYKLTDKTGNTTNKVVEIWVISENPLVNVQQNAIVSLNSYTRAITKEFYEKSYDEGGLADASIWKTNDAYNTALTGCFDTLQSDTGYQEVWHFSHYDVVRVQQFIETNGIGNSKVSNDGTSALSKFVTTFGNCKQ